MDLILQIFDGISKGRIVELIQSNTNPVSEINWKRIGWILHPVDSHRLAGCNQATLQLELVVIWDYYYSIFQIFQQRGLKPCGCQERA